MSLSPLIKSNKEVLEAAKQIVADLEDDQYCCAPSPLFGSSVGAHIRHICDHYRCFFTGVESDLLDYDQRERCPNIERERKAAIAQIEQLLGQLSALGQDDAPLQVMLKTQESTQEVPVASSAARELVFLHGHTTHHFALIAAMLKAMDLPVDAQLGVAPSTTVFQQQASALRC